MFDWVTLSNPVAIWWLGLSIIAVLNIVIWFITYFHFRDSKLGLHQVLIFLSAVYVFGCAFRSVLPRADVQRICLFDTWFSNVLLGRTVATVAELGFVAQWAVVLYLASKTLEIKWTQFIARIIFPLIVIAECFSWYAVITTHYLGNTLEESIWAFVYFLIMISLFGMWNRLRGSIKGIVGVLAIGCGLYVAFMLMVDVPMYYNRWKMDIAEAKKLLGFAEGLNDLNSRWVVTHSLTDWKTEIPWMSLYFSVAVWTSLALCYFPVVRKTMVK